MYVYVCIRVHSIHTIAERIQCTQTTEETIKRCALNTQDTALTMYEWGNKEVFILLYGPVYFQGPARAILIKEQWQKNYTLLFYKNQ